ncbi:MAG: hypothetical protein WC346_17595 [Methanogenium sp.]|jgi:hypothetical protein
MNNKYKITIKHPLVRPGIEIETEASETYLVRVLEKTMDIVREFNNGRLEKIVTPLKEETVEEKDINKKEFHINAEEFLYRKGFKYTNTKEISRALVVVLMEGYAAFKVQEMIKEMKK